MAVIIQILALSSLVLCISSLSSNVESSTISRSLDGGSYIRNKRSFSDQTVKIYQAERTCGLSEMCKEEFRKSFRCKCPSYFYCRSNGKYYNAFCSINDTGYVWVQPSDFRSP